MWSYQKKLEYPINIRKPDARAAKIIMTQYGGPKCRWIEKTSRNCNDFERSFEIFNAGVTYYLLVVTLLVPSLCY